MPMFDLLHILPYLRPEQMTPIGISSIFSKYSQYGWGHRLSLESKNARLNEISTVL